MPNAQLLSVSQEEYRAMPGLNQSSLKAYADDPEKYIGEQRGTFTRAETTSLTFGADLDHMVFRGKLPFILIPEEVLNDQGKRMGKPWTDWRDEKLSQFPGAELLKADEYEKRFTGVMLAYDNLRQHSKANSLLLDERNTRRHLVITWEDAQTGVPCKCEIDSVHRAGHITDLKTAMDNTPEGFARAIWNFKYYVQGAWYRRAVHELMGEWLPFSFVTVKNKPGYGCRVYQLSEEFIVLGEDFLQDWVPLFVESMRDNIWLPPGHGTVEVLKPERWMLYKTKRP